MCYNSLTMPRCDSLRYTAPTGAVRRRSGAVGGVLRVKILVKSARDRGASSKRGEIDAREGQTPGPHFVAEGRHPVGHVQPQSSSPAEAPDPRTLKRQSMENVGSGKPCSRFHTLRCPAAHPRRAGIAPSASSTHHTSRQLRMYYMFAGSARPFLFRSRRDRPPASIADAIKRRIVCALVRDDRRRAVRRFAVL